MSHQDHIQGYNMRRYLVVSAFSIAMVSLIARGFYLQVLDHDYLRGEADARQLRTVEMSAHRGPILDRNGEAVAISTPVDSVWANPSELIHARERLPELAGLLDLDTDVLLRRLASKADKEFIYIKRRINPDMARRVMALQLPGISLQREYRRFYPMGEVMAHVLGFTNVDDHGQEGLELAYNEWLRGEPGLKRVIRDRLGRVIDDVEQIRSAEPGKQLQLSLDARLQYLAYRELKQAVKRHGAKSGSVVVMRPQTGEVLAMVNQPAFNPNNRKNFKAGIYRNRAVTDVFEPGSTIKPFVVAAAIESGRFSSSSSIDTAPGYFRLHGHLIKDNRNYGKLKLGKILSKSSNVGASKLAMELKSEQLWEILDGVGFGRTTGSGFPGESSGLMNDYTNWREIEQAILAYGYGMSVTPLQLAEAYSVLAADGAYRPASFLAVGEVAPTQVMRKETARAVRTLLTGVVDPDGTGYAASVGGYTVAGKTGTVKKSVAGGYSEDRYIAVFAGMAPASQPELVTVVMINEPSGDEYYGGRVAAPVFAKVMAGALRYLDVAPDDFSYIKSAASDGRDQRV